MAILDPVWGLVTDDVAIDLGTSTTKMTVKGMDKVVTEPTVVSIDRSSGEILSIGKEAKRMIGRTPATIEAVRPLRDGVVSDFETTRDMIQYFIEIASRSSTRFFKIPRPRAVIAVPSSASEVGRQAIQDAAKNAGARMTYVLEQPMAAAIGAGLPVTEPMGSMIVDIGGGTSDIAVISLKGIVVDKTVPVAGDEMDDEIVKYMRHKYNLLIGDRIAEDLKIKIGTAYPVKENEVYEVRGRDILQGIPKTVKITSVEIREALQVQLNIIATAITDALEEAPPEIIADLGEQGICLAGGGARIPGIKEFFEDRVNMDFYVADDPVFAVLRGLTDILDDLDLLSKLKISEDDLL